MWRSAPGASGSMSSTPLSPASGSLVTDRGGGVVVAGSSAPASTDGAASSAAVSSSFPLSPPAAANPGKATRATTRAGRALAERNEEFAAVISAEAAKPIKTARVEAARAVDTINFSAAVTRTLGGELIPLDASAAGEGKVGFVKRVPIGVIAAISPFN